MKGKKCPACSHLSYFTEPGFYDTESKKLTPDWSNCGYCGFTYQEDIRWSEQGFANEYRETEKFKNRKIEVE